MALNVEAWDAPITWPTITLPTAFVAPASTQVARFADRGFATRGSDTPANALYENRLVSDVAIEQRIDALTEGGQVALTAAELEFWNGDGYFNTIADNGAMDGRLIRVKTSNLLSFAASDWGAPLADATLVWEGRVGRVDPGQLRARLQLRDLSERLLTRLQTTIYDGGGGLGGAPELKGLPKPLSFGNRFNVSPTYIGLMDLGVGELPTYQTHYRQIVGHDAVKIRGVPQVRVDTTPAIGEFVDFPTLGLFQLGSTADGVVTCDVRGDAPGGQYSRTVSDIVRTLLTSLGPSFALSDFDSASWFAFEPTMPHDIGWGLGTEFITANDGLSEILRSCVAFMSGSRRGQMRLCRMAAPNAAADFTLTRADIKDCDFEPLPLALQPTPQAVEILAGRNWAPSDDIAGVITGDERAALAGEGAYERAFSNTIAARSATNRVLRLPGLFRTAEGAQARASELRTWLERGLRAYRVVTDRYLGQVEIGMTGRITYPFAGLSGGWSGLVVGWREQIGARRLELTLIG